MRAESGIEVTSSDAVPSIITIIFTGNSGGPLTSIVLSFVSP